MASNALAVTIHLDPCDVDRFLERMSQQCMPGMLVERIPPIRPAGNRFNVKVVAAILSRANTGPGLGIRDRFFEVKRHLLERLGERVGSKTQKIELLCWGLRGHGCPRGGCPRCGGTGVYRTRIVHHAEYELHGFRFLVPIESRPPVENEIVDIVGRVPHLPKDGSMACAEAIVIAFAPHWIDHDTADVRRLVASIGPIPPSLLIEIPEDNDVPF